MTTIHQLLAEGELHDLRLTVAGLASIPKSNANAESAIMSLLVLVDHWSSARDALICTKLTASMIYNLQLSSQPYGLNISP